MVEQLWLQRVQQQQFEAIIDQIKRQQAMLGQFNQTNLNFKLVNFQISLMLKVKIMVKLKVNLRFMVKSKAFSQINPIMVLLQIIHQQYVIVIMVMLQIMIITKVIKIIVLQKVNFNFIQMIDLMVEFIKAEFIKAESIKVSYS